jgi:hypothetical protein
MNEAAKMPISVPSGRRGEVSGIPLLAMAR